jgi:flagellar basal body-associated protein FliL
MPSDKSADADAAPKKGGIKTIIMVAVPVLIVGLLGGFMGRPVLEDLAGTNEGDTGTNVAGEALAALDRSVITSLGDFTVNLRDGTGSRLLQMGVSFEGPQSQASQLEERRDQIRDTILVLASDYNFDELEGTGKLQLRDDILARVQAITSTEGVTRVYFTAFVIQ